LFSLDEKYSSANTKLTQKIQTLIIGRLLVIVLLLVASWIWNNRQLKLSFEDLPGDLFLLIKFCRLSETQAEVWFPFSRQTISRRIVCERNRKLKPEISRGE